MIDDHPVQTADILLKSTLRLAYRLRDDLDRVDTYQNMGLAVSDSTSYQPELLISVMSHSCPRLERIVSTPWFEYESALPRELSDAGSRNRLQY
jgi:hypothetical protein